MKQNSMILIGLTGGIGTGKSTVSKVFKENNIPVVDADFISRKVLTAHPEILLKIKEKFGGDFFDEEGNLLRRKVGNLIFSDLEKKKEYEDIVIPYVKNDIYKEIDEYHNNNEKICVVDAPTLIETGLYSDMNIVVVVSAKDEIQVRRVMARDGFSREEALLRISNQMSTIEKCKYADFIIDNNGSIENTRKQVKDFLNKLQML